MGLISGCGERTNLAMNLVHSLLRDIRNKYPKGQNKKRMSRSCFDRSVKVQGNSYYVVLVKANESNSLGRLVRSCPLLIDLPRPLSPRSKECQSNSREWLWPPGPRFHARSGMIDSSFSD
jgi:hypothetical protein